MLLIIASSDEMISINLDTIELRIVIEEQLLTVNGVSLLAKKNLKYQWLDLFLQKVNHAITHNEPILIERI